MKLFQIVLTTLVVFGSQLVVAQAQPTIQVAHMTSVGVQMKQFKYRGITIHFNFSPISANVAAPLTSADFTRADIAASDLITQIMNEIDAACDKPGYPKRSLCDNVTSEQFERIKLSATAKAKKISVSNIEFRPPILR
jgi:hypothetical protein